MYVEDLAAAHVLALKPRREEPHVQPRVRTRRSRSASSPRRCAISSATSRSRSARPGPATTAPASSRATAPRDELGWVAAAHVRRGPAQDARLVPRADTPARERARRRSDAPRRAGSRWFPAYNEEPTVAAVLDELYPLVDELVVVDDGSTDNTRAEIEQWMAARPPELPAARARGQPGHVGGVLTALTELRDRLRARRARRRRPRVHRRRRRPARPARARRARRDDRSPKGSTRTSPGATSRTTGRSSARATGCCRSGRAVGRAHRSTTSSRAIASSASARSRTRSTSTRATSTARPSRSRSCCASSATTCATTTSCRCRSRGRARACATPRSTSRSSRSPRARLAPDRYREALRTDARVCRSLGPCGRARAHHRWTRSDDVDPVLRVVGARGARRSVALLRRLVPRPSLALLGSLRRARRRVARSRNAPTLGSAIVLAGVFGVGAALAAPPARGPARRSSLGVSSRSLIAVRLDHLRTTLLGSRSSRGRRSQLSSRVRAIRPPQHAPAHVRRSAARSSSSRSAGSTGYFGASTVGATWFGGGVVHGPRNSDEVAITFDDGPDLNRPPAIMKILDAADVKGSFFVVGKTLDASTAGRARPRRRRLSSSATTRTTTTTGAGSTRATRSSRARQHAFARESRHVPGLVPAAARPADAVDGAGRAQAPHAHGDVGRLGSATAATTPAAIADRGARRRARRIDHRPARRPRRHAGCEPRRARRGAARDPRGPERPASEPVRLDQLLGAAPYTSCS